MNINDIKPNMTVCLHDGDDAIAYITTGRKEGHLIELRDATGLHNGGYHWVDISLMSKPTPRQPQGVSA